MDEVIFEEFKGTGNMEIVLNKSLSEKRIFPAIDIAKSGTRREDLLYSKSELETIFALRKSITQISQPEFIENLISQMQITKNNNELIKKLKDILK